MLRVVSTDFARLMLWFRGIHCGKKCVFYGLPVIYRNFGSDIQIGDHCVFRSDKTSNLVGVNRRCIISTTRETAVVKIGDNSRFSGTVIRSAERVEIGRGVLCGANVLILDFDGHGVDPAARHHNPRVVSKPVVIEDNVWLGINTVVLKGVRIGRNAVVGANSLVVKDIPPDTVAGGNPCKVLKHLKH